MRNAEGQARTDKDKPTLIPNLCLLTSEPKK
jgi:hypothetical protein